MNATLIVTVETPEFKTFYAGTVKIHEDYMTLRFPRNPRDAFRFADGGRYIKIIRGSGVHCFVDKISGDVLKAASWKAPAKHARGNIFDAKNGLGMMGEYGPAYLR